LKKGKHLENLVKEANKIYFEQDIAHVFKQEAPVAFVGNRSFVSGKGKLDFIGLIKKGVFIEFECKTTKSTTSFRIGNDKIPAHQKAELITVDRFGGISFLLVMLEEYEETYLIPTEQFITVIEQDSIKINYIRNSPEFAYKVESKGKIKLDYLSAFFKYIKFKIKVEDEAWKLSIMP
jgi:recombination protein U